MAEATKLPVKTEERKAPGVAPWRPFESLRHEIDRLFEDFDGGMWRSRFGRTTLPAFAYLTQADWEVNLVNEAGVPSRAWIDYPGHIWVAAWNEGAFYSPDGMTIQFDNGSVWQRVVEVPVLAPAIRRHYRPYRPIASNG